MKTTEEQIFNQPKNKRFKNDPYLWNESFNKSRIYNLESRKKPAELVRKDLISAMKLPDHELLNREDYFLILDSWREEWEKGVQVPVNPDALPHSIIKPTDYDSSNDYIEQQFTIPKELIMYEDLIDNHISNYELDLQDICWLQTVRESDLDLDLSQNFFEYVIDKFEQQCANNIKARQFGIEYDDHIVCDVCQSPDGEDGNEMVFCDLCNICVHQACYGIQEIPEGDWLCKPCKDLGFNKKNALCTLCPNVGGALKPTTKPNKWAHVSCVYWIPEAKFLDLSLLEPVEIKSIPNWRWNLVCSLCNVKKGAPIICDEKNCRCSYHVTCAFKHKLKMKIALTDEKSNIRLKSYCIKHSQQNQEHVNVKYNKNIEIDFFTNSTENNNENESNQPKKEKVNPLCEFWKYIDINQICHETIEKYFGNNINDNNNDNDDGDSNNNNKNNPNLDIVKNYSINQSSLNQIIDLIYHYWRLKRLSNYGNSLIKMTFAEKFQEQLKFHKNQILSLRYHLERLRTLTYMICRREKLKYNWINTQKTILEATLSSFARNENSNEESFFSEKLSNEHKRLFSRIITHHNIYSKSENQIVLKSEENEPGIINVARNKKHKSLEKTTNSLIREIKHFKKVQASKNNPYKKFYLSSIKSRKPIYLSNGNSDEKNNTNNNENISVMDQCNTSNLVRSNVQNSNKKITSIEEVNLNNSKNLKSEIHTIGNSNIPRNLYLPFNNINEERSNVKFSHSQIENEVLNLRNNLHKKTKLSNENHFSHSKVSWLKMGSRKSINGHGSHVCHCNGVFKRFQRFMDVTSKTTFNNKKYPLRKKV